jgi:hypothetical protein
MPIAEGVVQSLIRNDARYAGLAGRNWELCILTGDRAFRTIYPIWDNAAETFEQRLATHGADEKALALAGNLGLHTPLMVGAYRRLHTGYPGAPDDLVVFDGCHRIMAVAIRAHAGQPLPACVGVFVEVR